MRSILQILFFFLLVQNVCSQCMTSYSGYAIDGQDLAQTFGQSTSCCAACQAHTGCVAYTWTNAKGGTCFLKSDVQPLYESNGAFTVMMKPTPDRTYSVNQSYDTSNFFDLFDFKTDNYGNGYTKFVDKATAQSMGIAKYVGNQVYLGTDNVTTLPWNDTKGRSTFRLESLATWNSGLFVFDISHLPTGPAIWPAFWTYGPNWPDEGEIDILESISNYTWNQITLHTNEGCENTVNDSNYFTGKWVLQNGKPGTNCWNQAPGQYNSAGCSIAAPDGTFNTEFNQKGGGMYVMEWDNEKFIRIWNFVRPNIPSDLANSSPNPNPSTWGMPTAYFAIGDNCPSKHFKNQVITINNAFCGWAGNYYPGGQCKCENDVRFAPQHYTEAYFMVNSLKVYCRPGDPCRVS